MGILKTQVAKAAIGLVQCAGDARWSALEEERLWPHLWLEASAQIKEYFRAPRRPGHEKKINTWMGVKKMKYFLFTIADLLSKGSLSTEHECFALRRISVCSWRIFSFLFVF